MIKNFIAFRKALIFVAGVLFISFCTAELSAKGILSILDSLKSTFQPKSKIEVPQIPPPLVYAGTHKPRSVVSLVWSTQCAKCRTLLRGDLWDIYYGAYTHQRDYAFLMLEYEDNIAVIQKNTVAAMCRGKDFYGDWTMANALAGMTPEAAAARSPMKEKIKNVCDDNKLAEIIATESFKELKARFPSISTKAPTVIFNGQVVTDIGAIRQELLK